MPFHLTPGLFKKRGLPVLIIRTDETVENDRERETLSLDDCFPCSISDVSPSRKAFATSTLPSTTQPAPTNTTSPNTVLLPIHTLRLSTTLFSASRPLVPTIRNTSCTNITRWIPGFVLPDPSHRPCLCSPVQGASSRVSASDLNEQESDAPVRMEVNE